MSDKLADRMDRLETEENVPVFHQHTEQERLAEEEQIERLEAGDPSTDDGRWGGGYCQPHGTYIGTPGGADYICGYCEDGATVWVDAPMFEFGFDGPVSFAGLGICFRLADIEQIIEGKPERWQKEAIIRIQKMMREVSGAQFEYPWMFKRVSSGYWDRP